MNRALPTCLVRASPRLRHAHYHVPINSLPVENVASNAFAPAKEQSLYMMRLLFDGAPFSFPMKNLMPLGQALQQPAAARMPCG